MAGISDILPMTDAAKPLQDARALNDLRLAARRDPGAVADKVASEFESLFTRELLKSMRAALPKSGLFDGPGKDMMTQMLDDQLARVGAGAPGGLGDMIARHLSRYIEPSSAPAGPETTASASADGSAAQRSGVGSGPAASDAFKTVAWRPSDSTSAGPDLDEVLGRARIVLENVPTWLEAAMQPEPPVSGLPDGRRPELFVSQLWLQATAAEATTGVPAPFIIGQAALESGWGRGEIKRPDGSPAYNLFGIKAGSSWSGDTVDVTTTEYVDGKPVRQVERFRAYGSYTEAFADWATLMRDNPRYAGVLQAADSVRDFAYGLQAAGYATDPRYGMKLENVINKAIEIRETRDAN